MHLQGTGVENDLIIENLKKIVDSKQTRVWLRVPVIPGFSDSAEYAGELAQTLTGVPVEKVSLLNYHEWGRPKYGLMGREYLLNGAEPLDKEKLACLKGILEEKGLRVTVDH
jgi:pyruvate formate lyase activating enzyme